MPISSEKPIVPALRYSIAVGILSSAVARSMMIPTRFIFLNRKYRCGKRKAAKFMEIFPPNLPKRIKLDKNISGFVFTNFA